MERRLLDWFRLAVTLPVWPTVPALIRNTNTDPPTATTADASRNAVRTTGRAINAVAMVAIISRLG